MNKSAIIWYKACISLFIIALTMLAGIEVGYRRGFADANFNSARLYFSQLEAIGGGAQRQDLYEIFRRENAAEIELLGRERDARNIVLSWSEYQNIATINDMRKLSEDNKGHTQISSDK